MSYFWRVATTIWLSIYWCAAMLFRVTALALGIVVLVVCVILDSLPKRKSKPLTSQAPNRRKLPLPIREGSTIFVLNPDGSRTDLTALEAVTQARAWNDVCFGALVRRETEIDAA